MDRLELQKISSKEHELQIKLYLNAKKYIQIFNFDENLTLRCLGTIDEPVIPSQWYGILDGRIERDSQITQQKNPIEGGKGFEIFLIFLNTQKWKESKKELEKILDSYKYFIPLGKDKILEILKEINTRWGCTTIKFIGKGDKYLEFSPPRYKFSNQDSALIVQIIQREP